MRLKILVLALLLFVFHLAEAATFLAAGDFTESRTETWFCHEQSSFVSGRGLNCRDGCQELRVGIGGQGVSLQGKPLCQVPAIFGISSLAVYDLTIQPSPGEVVGQSVVVEVLPDSVVYASLSSGGVQPLRGTGNASVVLELSLDGVNQHDGAVAESHRHTGPNTTCFPLEGGEFCVPETTQAVPPMNFAPGRFSAVIGDVVTLGFVGTTRAEVLGDLYSYGQAQLIVDIGLRVSLDQDSDLVPDDTDNCTQVSNADQRDTDGDGYGNVCDGDFNQDGVVGTPDSNYLRDAMGTSDPHADLDGDGTVTMDDFSVFQTLFGLPPGPSGLVP